MLFPVVRMDEDPRGTRIVGREMGAENLRSGDEEEPRETKKEQQQGWGWGASKAQGPRSQEKKGFQGGGNTKLDQMLQTIRFSSLRVLVTLTGIVDKIF